MLFPFIRIRAIRQDSPRVASVAPRVSMISIDDILGLLFGCCYGKEWD